MYKDKEQGHVCSALLLWLNTSLKEGESGVLPAASEYHTAILTGK